MRSVALARASAWGVLLERIRSLFIAAPKHIGRFRPNQECRKSATKRSDHKQKGIVGKKARECSESSAHTAADHQCLQQAAKAWLRNVVWRQ
jgi:hypothetical protein